MQFSDDNLDSIQQKYLYVIISQNKKPVDNIKLRASELFLPRIFEDMIPNLINQRVYQRELLIIEDFPSQLQLNLQNQIKFHSITPNQFDKDLTEIQKRWTDTIKKYFNDTYKARLASSKVVACQQIILLYKQFLQMELNFEQRKYYEDQKIKYENVIQQQLKLQSPYNQASINFQIKMKYFLNKQLDPIQIKNSTGLTFTTPINSQDGTYMIGCVSPQICQKPTLARFYVNELLPTVKTDKYQYNSCPTLIINQNPDGCCVQQNSAAQVVSDLANKYKNYEYAMKKATIILCQMYYNRIQECKQACQEINQYIYDVQNGIKQVEIINENQDQNKQQNRRQSLSISHNNNQSNCIRTQFTFSKKSEQNIQPIQQKQQYEAPISRQTSTSTVKSSQLQTQKQSSTIFNQLPTAQNQQQLQLLHQHLLQEIYTDSNSTDQYDNEQLQQLNLKSQILQSTISNINSTLKDKDITSSLLSNIQQTQQPIQNISLPTLLDNNSFQADNNSTPIQPQQFNSQPTQSYQSQSLSLTTPYEVDSDETQNLNPFQSHMLLQPLNSQQRPYYVYNTPTIQINNLYIYPINKKFTVFETLTLLTKSLMLSDFLPSKSFEQQKFTVRLIKEAGFKNLFEKTSLKVKKPLETSFHEDSNGDECNVCGCRFGSYRDHINTKQHIQEFRNCLHNQNVKEEKFAQIMNETQAENVVNQEIHESLASSALIRGFTWFQTQKTLNQILRQIGIKHKIQVNEQVMNIKNYGQGVNQWAIEMIQQRYKIVNEILQKFNENKINNQFLKEKHELINDIINETLIYQDEIRLPLDALDMYKQKKKQNKLIYSDQLLSEAQINTRKMLISSIPEIQQPIYGIQDEIQENQQEQQEQQHQNKNISQLINLYIKILQGQKETVHYLLTGKQQRKKQIHITSTEQLRGNQVELISTYQNRSLNFIRSLQNINSKLAQKYLECQQISQENKKKQIFTQNELLMNNQNIQYQISGIKSQNLMDQNVIKINLTNSIIKSTYGALLLPLYGTPKILRLLEQRSLNLVDAIIGFQNSIQIQNGQSAKRQPNSLLIEQIELIATLIQCNIQ